MRLIFLGTGGYQPNEIRHTASILLPDVGIALDAGTGFFRVPKYLETRHLDVFLTHAHLDHVCGLTFFLVPVLRGDVDVVRIHGAASVLAAVRRHLFAEEIFPVDPPFEWCELPADEQLNVSDSLVSWTSLEHPGGSLGYRFQFGNKSLAYITDTTAPGNYLAFIQGVDVLIHECYFADDMSDWAIKTGHSFSSAVADIARKSGAGRLYLVHADPLNISDDPIGLGDIREQCPNAEIATDLMEIEF